MGSSNELAELYDSLRRLYEHIPDDSVEEWRKIIASVLYGGEYTAKEGVPYGEQQLNRNHRKMDHYRSRYGDGDRITDFSEITVAPPRTQDMLFVDSDIKVPVAPQSQVALPLYVTDSMLSDAIELLLEFPAEPAADSPGSGQDELLDTTVLERQGLLKRGASQSIARILFVSDTHLGYENRVSGTGSTVPWIDEISTEETFTRIIELAIENDVDAVVHTGDILDHEVDTARLTTAEQALSKLANHGIPFYFIIGSHDRGLPERRGITVQGVEWLRSQVKNGHAIELTPAATSVPGTNLQIFGIPADNVGLDKVDSYRSLDFDQSTIRFRDADSQSLSILCLHNGVPPYRSGSGVEIDLHSLLNKAPVGFDCILVGDEHRPKNLDFKQGYSFELQDTPVRYTGPAVPISHAYEDNAPFVTELTLKGDTARTTRIYLE